MWPHVQPGTVRPVGTEKEAVGQDGPHHSSASSPGVPRRPQGATEGRWESRAGEDERCACHGLSADHIRRPGLLRATTTGRGLGTTQTRSPGLRLKHKAAVLAGLRVLGGLGEQSLSVPLPASRGRHAPWLTGAPRSKPHRAPSRLPMTPPPACLSWASMMASGPPGGMERLLPQGPSPSTSHLQNPFCRGSRPWDVDAFRAMTQPTTRRRASSLWLTDFTSGNIMMCTHFHSPVAGRNTLFTEFVVRLAKKLKKKNATAEDFVFTTGRRDTLPWLHLASGLFKVGESFWV